MNLQYIVKWPCPIQKPTLNEAHEQRIFFKAEFLQFLSAMQPYLQTKLGYCYMHDMENKMYRM